jgi:hypothetical protein
MLTKTIYFIMLFIVLSTNTFSQDFQWAKQMGGTGWDEGTSIAVDKNNNIYTTGRFKGTVDFDLGPGIFNLTSVGEEDVFISKLDSDGNFIWAKQFGDSAFIESHALVLDSVGNIYTTGSFLGQVDFNPGSGTFRLTSSYWDRDIFIQKLDANGNFIWAKQISGLTPTPAGTPSPTDAYSIAADGLGNIYITGYFDGEVDFNPDVSSTFYLSAVQASDIFVCKLNTDGNFIWAKQLGGTQGAVGYAIAVDKNGNIYSTGTIGGTVDFDPGPSVFNLSPSDPFQAEVYVSKLDSSGNFLWAKPMGSGQGLSIAVDDNSNVYMSGWFPSGKIPVINKLDSSGNLVWAKPLGGLNGKSIVLDNSGNIYTTGSCSGTNDFDPGPGVFNLSAGSEDAFISKLNTAGNFIWAGLFMSTNQVYTNSIAVDLNDNIYTTGFFYGTTDFDPATTIYNLSAPSSYNIFIDKLAPTGNLGILENSFRDKFKIYPNPTEGNLLIDFEREHDNIHLVLTNSIGQKIYTKSVTNSKHAEIQINGAAGIYMLEIMNQEKQKALIQIIKK